MGDIGQVLVTIDIHSGPIVSFKIQIRYSCRLVCIHTINDQLLGLFVTIIVHEAHSLNPKFTTLSLRRSYTRRLRSADFGLGPRKGTASL